MVTGKNKEKFEEWCCENGNYALYNKKYLALMDEDDCHIIYFNELPHEMQKGVIEAYYDSMNILVDIYPIEYKFNLKFGYTVRDIKKDTFKSRKEATIAAFEEADKLRNKELNKKIVIMEQSNYVYGLQMVRERQQKEIEQLKDETLKLHIESESIGKQWFEVREENIKLKEEIRILKDNALNR